VTYQYETLSNHKVFNLGEAKWFYVLINEEADKTISHWPLKLYNHSTSMSH